MIIRISGRSLDALSVIFEILRHMSWVKNNDNNNNNNGTLTVLITCPR